MINRSRRAALAWLRRKSVLYAKHTTRDRRELTELLVAIAKTDSLPLTEWEIAEAARVALGGPQ